MRENPIGEGGAEVGKGEGEGGEGGDRPFLGFRFGCLPRSHPQLDRCLSQGAPENVLQRCTHTLCDGDGGIVPMTEKVGVAPVTSRLG